VDRDELDAQVRAAARGDQEAYDALVERFSGLVWAVVRAHRLRGHDAEDVFQTTWLRLVEHLDRIREPRALGGWLATTARHESLRVLRTGTRALPTSGDELDRFEGTEPEPVERLAGDERALALWRAIDGLADRCRQLLRVLLADPAPSYEQVSAALDIPVGSIGPTRGRCLARLREDLRSRGITDVLADSS
jgi:RNA polymerase sigma factor (sigma-70 family)